MVSKPPSSPLPGTARLDQKLTRHAPAPFLPGGSLRIPAACTGIFTIRPSFGRFPVRGCRSGMPGQEAVLAVNGPMARTLSDVVFYSKTVVDSQPWLRDPKCLPVPWRAVELPERLRIGVMWHDAVVRPTPPVRRALQDAVDKLRAAGHDVVDWDPVDQNEGVELLMRMFVADGGKTIKHELHRTGEPLRHEMIGYETAEELGTADMWKLHLERTAFQNKYLDRWTEAGLDAIICPTTPYSTVKNGEFKYGEFCSVPSPSPNQAKWLTAGLVGYTGVFNVLDYSAVSFPSPLSVDAQVDIKDPDYSPLSSTCKEVNDTCKSLTISFGGLRKELSS